MDRTMYVLRVLVVAHAMMLSSSACPQECACSATQAECYRRHLQVIPDGIPENVLRLDLRDNQITDVDAAKLSRLHSLETLSLQMNHLSKLKSLTFVNLTRLTRLHIANNEIETIDDNVFQGLPSLKDLDLTNNKLSDITERFHIASLQRLVLKNNEITSLQDNTLNGVRRLQYLILSNNNISYISKLSLAGMTRLTYLDLHGNPLKNIDNILGGVTTLSYLDISACHLANIPKDLPWPLRYLKISDNNLTMIQAQDLRSTRYLAHLIADNNQIQAIQDGALLYTSYMNEVCVSHNKMRLLPQIPKNVETFIADNNEIFKLFQFSFAHDSAMKLLSLRNNNISEIPPNTFSRLSNLNALILGHNGIKHLQNMSFAGPRQLTALNLEFNPVEKIDYRAFGGLQKLEKLNLSHIDSNQTVIEGPIFQDVPSLVSLYLQGSPSIINDILNSSELLRSLRNIQHLYMTNGNLETIPTDIKHFLPHLKSIQLSDNPWHCDGELVGLHNWINESKELFGDSNITCASPDHLRGRSIQDVSIKELTMAAPTDPTYFSSHSLAFTLNATATFDENMNQTEATTSGKLGDTQLFHLPSTTSIVQVMKSEIVIVTSPFEAPGITTSPEVATLSAYFEKNRSKEHQVPASSMTSDHLYTHGRSTLSPSLTIVISTASELHQLFPSTAVPELRSSMSEKVTLTISLSTLDGQRSGGPIWPDNRIPATSTPREVSSLASAHMTENMPTKVLHASNIPIHSIPAVTTQITNNSTSTSTVRPTSVTDTVQLSNVLASATQFFTQPRHTNDISTLVTLPPRSSSSSSTLAPSMITLPITQLVISTSNPTTAKTPAPTTTPMLVPNTITQFELTTTRELSTAEVLTTPMLVPSTIKQFVLTTRELSTAEIIITPSLPTWNSSQTETLKSIPASEFVNGEEYAGLTSVTENTVLHDTTQILLAEQNSTDSERYNNGDPIKRGVKFDKSTFSRSGDNTQRVIIITVSTTLLVLIVSLVIVVAVVRYRKKRKFVAFDDTTKNTDIQTETSDTVFIISHMESEQQHTDNLNTDTSQDGQTSADSPKDTPEATVNSSKQTKKSLKFSRQSASTVMSKTRFNCIKGQPEDDSELLMYSWT